MSAIGRRERQKAETRAELLAAAHALVKEDGYEGLTIRSLAKRAGFATMSVYSYFPDKHSILLALADDGFAELARRWREQMPDEPLAALRHLLTQYVAYGLENPNEYRTVFMTNYEPEETGKSIHEIEEVNPALRIVMERVAACVAAGHLKGDVHAIGTLLWTMSHGAVSLLISFPAYPFGDAKAYAEQVGDLALAAVASREIEPLTDAPACTV